MKIQFEFFSMISRIVFLAFSSFHTFNIHNIILTVVCPVTVMEFKVSTLVILLYHP